MSKLVWHNIGRFLLLALFQVLVLNNVYLGSYIIPMIYVLFILMLPTGMKRIPLLLIAFGTGLLIDIMNNMPGFHSLACTVVAMMRIWFADSILTRGEPVQVQTPSIYSVTPQYFIAYLVLMLAVFYLLFYITELWGFRGFGDMLLATVLSTLVTTMLAVLYQFVFIKRKEEA